MFFDSFLRRETVPLHPALWKNSTFFAEVDQSRPIETYEFVVLDTELTGMSKRRDEIISIGAVRVRDLRIVADEAFYSHVRPSSLAPRKSTLVHRLTPQELAEAPGLKGVLADFIDFCGSAFLVGHYVGLDIGFINAAAKKLFGGALRNPCLDTIRLAQAYSAMCWEHHANSFDLQVSFNLADLAATYGLPSFSAHNALQDALQTAYLFLFLVKKIRQLGCVTLKDFFAADRSRLRIL